MATKKPALTTQLRKAQEELKEANTQIEKLQKELASSKSSYEWQSKKADKAEAEVESLHSLLDVLPNAIARKTIPDPEQTWKVVEHSLMTRLAAFLALRSN